MFRLETKDGSTGFDFEDEFIEITPFKAIHYKLEDERAVAVEFLQTENGVKVIETFDAEKSKLCRTAKARLAWHPKQFQQTC